MGSKPAIEEAVRGLYEALMNGTDRYTWSNALSNGTLDFSGEFQLAAEASILLYLNDQMSETPYQQLTAVFRNFWQTAGPHGISEHGALWYIALAICQAMQASTRMEAYATAVAALSKRANNTGADAYLALDLVFADLESWRTNPNRDQVRSHMRKAAEAGRTGGTGDRHAQCFSILDRKPLF